MPLVVRVQDHLHDAGGSAGANVGQRRVVSLSMVRRMEPYEPGKARPARSGKTAVDPIRTRGRRRSMPMTIALAPIPALSRVLYRIGARIPPGCALVTPDLVAELRPQRVGEPRTASLERQ